jgi:hypothetical protein
MLRANRIGGKTPGLAFAPVEFFDRFDGSRIRSAKVMLHLLAASEAMNEVLK